MRSDEDTRAGAAREMKQSAEDLTAKFATATSFYRPEIIAVGAEKVKAFVAAEPKLKPYQPWLDDILRYAPHTLSAPEEKVAAQASMMEPGPGNAYNTLKDSELPWPEVVLSSGGKVRLDHKATPNTAPSPTARTATASSRPSSRVSSSSSARSAPRWTRT